MVLWVGFNADLEFASPVLVLLSVKSSKPLKTSAATKRRSVGARRNANELLKEVIDLRDLPWTTVPPGGAS